MDRAESIARRDAGGTGTPRRRWLLWFAAGAVSLGVLGCLPVAATNLIVLARAGREVHGDPAQVGPAEAAIVLGAQVRPDGTMSRMLADRVSQGVALWRAGRVKYVLVSGDHHEWGYDEPTTMRRAMMSAGVPEDVIFTDHAGLDTRASMERARRVFRIADAVVVTQGFHMKRALYLARSAGLKTQGLTSDLHPYGVQGLKGELREVGARVKAFLDVLTGRPVTGGPPVPVTGPARASWGPPAPPGTPPAGAPGVNGK